MHLLSCNSHRDVSYFSITRSSDSKELSGSYFPRLIYSWIGPGDTTFWPVFKSRWIVNDNAFDFCVSLLVFLKTRARCISTHESIFVRDHRCWLGGRCHVDLFCNESYHRRTKFVIWVLYKRAKRLLKSSSKCGRLFKAIIFFGGGGCCNTPPPKSML